MAVIAIAIVSLVAIDQSKRLTDSKNGFFKASSDTQTMGKPSEAPTGAFTTRAQTHQEPKDSRGTSAADVEERKLSAQAEINRVLSCKVKDVLKGTTGAHKKRDFRRIALLLHPDKGLVSESDERAKLAWRLVSAAGRQIVG